jgi:hypothetical protein
MIVVIAEQPLFPEALFKPACRQRRLATGKPALGEGDKLGDPSLGRGGLLFPQCCHQPPEAIQCCDVLEDLVEGGTTAFFDMLGTQREFPPLPLLLAPARFLLPTKAVVLFCRREYRHAHGDVARHRLDPLDLCVAI